MPRGGVLHVTLDRPAARNARSALARLMGVDAVNGPLSDAFDPPTDVGPLDEWQAAANADWAKAREVACRC